MHFINRLKRYLLVSVLCVTTVFSMPVQAKTKSKSNAQKAAEQAAAAALQAEIDARYNKEIDSNSWENWPTGPQVYAESAIVMEASTGTILYAKGIDEQHLSCQYYQDYDRTSCSGKLPDGRGSYILPQCRLFY